MLTGLGIKGCWEPNCPAAPSNFARKPKDVLVSVVNTLQKLLNMQLVSLKKNLISSPG